MPAARRDLRRACSARRRAAACGTRRSSAGRPPRAACTSSGIDAPTSSSEVHRAARGAPRRRARRGRTARRRRSRRRRRARRARRRSRELPGASTDSPPAARRPEREQRSRRLGEQRLAGALARSTTPGRAPARAARAGGHVPQQRGPRAVPAHRERQRPARAAARRARSRFCPSQSAWEAGQHVDRVAARAPALRARGQEPRRLARRVDARTAAHGSSATARRRAPPRSPAELRPHRGGLVVEAPVLERGERRGRRRREQQVGARRVDALADRIAAARPACPRSSCTLPAARDRIGRRQLADVDAVGRAPSTTRTLVRCGTGKSSASSPGPSNGSTGPRTRRRHHDSAVDGPSPSAAARDSTTHRAVDAHHGRRPRRARGDRATNPTVSGTGERFSTSTTTTPPCADRTRVRRAARPRRPARAPPSRTTGAAPSRVLPDARLVGRDRCQRSSAPIHQSSARSRRRHRAAVVDRRERARRRARRRPRARSGLAPTHRMPCSSGFALRSISSGTRSAGRAPS